MSPGREYQLSLRSPDIFGFAKTEPFEPSTQIPIEPILTWIFRLMDAYGYKSSNPNNPDDTV